MNIARVISYIRGRKYHWPVDVARRLVPGRNGAGVDIPGGDWDNLIVLDACRFDLYQELGPIAGELDSIISRGSATAEWFSQNFDCKSFPDIVFVAGNPAIDRINAGFADIYRMWPEDWDYDGGTARPENMVSKTLKAHREYPDKRIVSMWVQPHIPFIGELGKSFDTGQITGGGIIRERQDVMSFWKRMALYDVDSDDAWAAYRENLELALPHVRDLIDQLDGRTVVTSDHGNCFGEWGLYGHPTGVHVDTLVRVPWEIVNSDERRKVTPANETVKTGSGSEESVKERLADLGYVT